MLSVILAASLASSSLYYTSTGPVELRDAQDVLAIRANAALAQELATQSGAKLERMFGDNYLLRGVTGAKRLGRLATERGALVLSSYYSPSELLMADGRILARFSTALDANEIQRRVLEAGGIGVKAGRPQQGLWDVFAATPAETLEVAARLQESHRAIWATPDFLYKKVKRAAPNDPFFEDQWHHDLIGTASAWDLHMGSPAIIIAIIDSGTEVNHEDLKDKIVAPYDALYEDEDANPDQYDAHGTACAGLAAATTNNGLGVAGVCPECSIMPVRIMSEDGYGRYDADSDAFYWAVDHGAQILSNSWGPAGQSSVPSNLAQAIQHVADVSREGKGGVILFASGNDYRENEDYELAMHPLVVGVGATSYYDLREDYSNWGNGLDITAPAGSVTVDITNGGYQAGAYMDSFGGTSAATPVAAGLVGLILSVEPSLTRGQVLSILQATADHVGNSAYVDGFNKYYGHGRVNALRALQATTGGEVCQPIPEVCDDAGVDDDCDGLINDDDTSCAPIETEVGRSCTQDFQCGQNGLCLAGYGGYTSGYCTTECSGTGQGTCPGDAVCVAAMGGSICLDACATIADCREGYDCLAVTGGSACLPSCTVTGCEAGEMCDAQTGDCYHDGPIAPGGPCTDNVQCANNARCYTESRWGIVDGFCGQRCEAASECPEAAPVCTRLGFRDVCMATCLQNDQCRAGLACRPNGDGTGTCYPACTSDADCDGELCNAYGLCGAELPPFIPEVVDTTCACDATFSCDADCACDPECAEDDGCAAVAPQSMAVLLGLALLVRRRKSVRA